MSMIGLTPEQRRLVEQAGDRPVRTEDAEVHQAYVLMRADVYERVRDVIKPRSREERHVRDGIRKSQEAFFRDLPEMLKDRGLWRRYVAYHGDELIGIARDDGPLIRECLRYLTEGGPPAGSVLGCFEPSIWVAAAAGAAAPRTGRRDPVGRSSASTSARRRARLR